jgi:hypothetical protein
LVVHVAGKVAKLGGAGKPGLRTGLLLIFFFVGGGGKLPEQSLEPPKSRLDGRRHEEPEDSRETGRN